ncbi:MAG: globin domain-containing protein [Actinomadura sp.]
MSPNPRVIKESFTHIESAADNAIAYFYSRLFTANPQLRTLFPAAMDVHRDRFFAALTKIVWSLDSPAALAAYLGRLGRDHRKFGVTPEHFAAFGAALIATARKFAADEWTEHVEAAWTQAWAEVTRLMTEAATEDADGGAPPWWVGEVLDHERRTPDIAVVTVRPAQPLPYAPGQHVSVQVSRWPRVWRQYSVANAPRGDGTLRLHVRALPAGWVSGALVRRTRVGDTLLLGPARGTMTLDPGSDRDLLCVAGGTGLAPMRALVEQVIASAKRRNTRLIFGARTERDLYDLVELRRLQSAHPWLRVIPVVSAEPGYDGLNGLAPDALDRLRGPEDHDVYVAGPTEMITHTVDRLQRLGVPPGQIHHDLVDADESRDPAHHPARSRRKRAVSSSPG